MARRQTVTLFLQQIPSNLPPSVWIRRVDTALLAGSLAFVFVYALLGMVLWRPLFGHPVPPGAFLDQLLDYPKVLIASLSHWHFYRLAAIDNPAALDLAGLHARLAPAFGLGLLAGAWVFKQGLTPWRRMRHIEGPQLLDEERSRLEMARIAKRETAKSQPILHLHPDLPLAKSRWTRGMLLYGSPGSGKTVALIPIIEQLVSNNYRSLIYDIKGDFTSYFLGGSVGLVCPWDRRSMVWDIGKDVRTPSQAAAFASSLIKEEEGNGKFWSVASRQLLEGVLRSLQNELKTEWGWTELAERLAADAPAFAQRMREHHPKAVALIADPKSQATSSVLATLSAYTSIVDTLALAWGDGREGNGKIRPHISFRAWAKDGYKGRKRQIILQAGPDKAASTALASAIINVVSPEILSAATPDNEVGRTLAFVLDELPSIGRIDFMGLIERGRSKGLIFIGACQTLEQIKEVWGEETMKSLGSMVGTHIVFRCQQSQSRDAIAEQFGKARWAVTAVNTTGGGGSGAGTNTSVHEESRAVVQPHELSELGPRTGKRFPLGWGISALVSLGGDVLTVEFPGVKPETRRHAHRRAAWTTRPAKDASVTAPSTSGGARDMTHEQGHEPVFVEEREPSAPQDNEPEPETPKQVVVGKASEAGDRIRRGAESSPLATLAAGVVGGHLVEAALHLAESVEMLEEASMTPEEDPAPVQTVRSGRG